MAKAIMLVGTASNVGKSILCTALCRILAQDGYRVAPFKAQNMSLNSAVTPSGREIGRAQAVQAEACGIPAIEHMNPVLLKPTCRDASQVILQGKVHSTQSARDYIHERTGEVWEAVIESYQYLSERYEVIVIEGAGSPVEMNLKPSDIANMRTAQMADAAVLLVADIDRGGVFAAVVGTIALLTPDERSRVQGIIVNKFRGDRTLFDDGDRLLEEYTGIPVVGVIPHIRDLQIEEEDSVGLASARYHRPEDENNGGGHLRMAVVQLPHLSNSTDFDALFMDPDVSIRFCTAPSEADDVHVILLPGTKNTVDDLLWLKETGWWDVIVEKHHGGTVVFGICGGFQMLGHQVNDPHFQESSTGMCNGLGLLPITTIMADEKRTVLVQGQLAEAWGAAAAGIPVNGYEIHMGISTPLPGYRPFSQIQANTEAEARWDGAVDETHQVMGTYLHGIFANDAFRQMWLTTLRQRFGLPELERIAEMTQMSIQEEAFHRLAEVVRSELQMDVVYRAIGVKALV